MTTRTYYRIDKYGQPWRVEETRIGLSEPAQALYNYALDKGDRTFHMTHGDPRRAAARELCDAGLFTFVSDAGGYNSYTVQYASRGD